LGADPLDSCEEALGHRFEERSLLRLALTHSSIKGPDQPSNERLEFLGDAILGLLVSEFLFRRFPDFSEGQLTKIKSVVVSSRTLGKRSRMLGIERHLSVGKGVAVDRDLPTSILGNVFEAILAAIFLDAGIEAARAFALRELGGEIERVLENRHPRNYKSLLQHLAQKRFSEVPSYRVLEESGPDHSKSFHVCAVVGGREFASAWGRSKRAAEQLAAKEAFEALRAEDGAAGAGADVGSADADAGADPRSRGGGSVGEAPGTGMTGTTGTEAGA